MKPETLRPPTDHFTNRGPGARLGVKPCPSSPTLRVALPKSQLSSRAPLLGWLSHTQYHAFETVRLCYPSRFYEDCLQQLRLSTITQEFESATENAPAPPSSRRRKSSATGLAKRPSLGRKKSGVPLQSLQADDIEISSACRGRNRVLTESPPGAEGHETLLLNKPRRLPFHPPVKPMVRLGT